MHDQGSEDPIDGIFFCVGEATFHCASDVACSTDISDNKGRRGRWWTRPSGTRSSDKILGDLGGAFSVPMVRMGDKLGLYRALNEQGPMTPGELAAKTNVAERYAREWLSHQAASGYLDYEPATGKFTLPPEQAMVLAEPDSPDYLQAAFDMAAVMLENQPKVEAGVSLRQGCRLGRSVALPVLHDRALLPDGLSTTTLWPRGCRRWTASQRSSSAARPSPMSAAGTGFRPSSWRTPSPNRLSSATTFIPRRWSRRGSHAEQHGATANTKFEVAMASDFPGKDLDLVTFFDCLHDMGDPVGAARHVRETLKPDGSWMIVEPAAGDRLEDNLNPVSRMYLRRLDDGLHPDLARSAGRRGARGAGRLRQALVGDHARRIRQGAQGD